MKMAEDLVQACPFRLQTYKIPEKYDEGNEYRPELVRILSVFFHGNKINNRVWGLIALKSIKLSRLISEMKTMNYP